MITKDLNKFSTKFLHALDKHFCPECSSNLMEAERRNENGVLYVWYECNRNGCDGQWCRKYP
jgi:hypothetical protein